MMLFGTEMMTLSISAARSKSTSTEIKHRATIFNRTLCLAKTPFHATQTTLTITHAKQNAKHLPELRFYNAGFSWRLV